MNEEQLKQLKPGDEIFIRAKYKRVLEDGDVLFSHSFTSVASKMIEADGYTHPENVISSISSQVNVIKNTETAPKYDPCRLFRAGDRVTPKMVNGRDFNNIAEEMKGKVLIVTRDENRSCNVYVRDGEDEFTIDPAYLELVTPVEELEPYIIKEYVDFYAVEKDGAQYSIFFKGSYYTKVKEAAEAECARLNAEHRKEQSNG